MHLTIAAIGRAKKGPEQTLCEMYMTRCSWPVTLAEYVVRKKLLPLQNQEEESRLLLDATAGADMRIALDERGEMLSTQALHTMLMEARGAGKGHIAFLIGGADGHTAQLRHACDKRIAFGPMTWPHMLVRAMLCEQIYRVWSIEQNHPYHRA